MDRCASKGRACGSGMREGQAPDIPSLGAHPSEASAPGTGMTGAGSSGWWRRMAAGSGVWRPEGRLGKRTRRGAQGRSGWGRRHGTEPRHGKDRKSREDERRADIAAAHRDCSAFDAAGTEGDAAGYGRGVGVVDTAGQGKAERDEDGQTLPGRAPVVERRTTLHKGRGRVSSGLRPIAGTRGAVTDGEPGCSDGPVPEI